MSAIAVIGIGCRLPGRIESPDALWEALLRGADLVTEVPQARWNADLDYDAVPGAEGRSVSRWGAFLEQPFGFDYPFFGIGEPEATAMDPQHRLLMEVTWEAAEHAGCDPRRLSGMEAGVFFGLSHQDYVQVTRDAGALGRAYSFTGTPFSMASGRVAHAMGLRGPAVSMDTACSSSLVAVHAARQSLLAHECRVAFAGGVMMMFAPTTFAAASGLGMLSPTGRCHAFDARADGFVRAEGCGVVMLKRLSDALNDKDRVLAVIRGSAVNQDGRTPNILAPSRVAQVAVVSRALAEAGVDAASVGMVEAHGTGTPVGDTEEFHSLSTHYGRSAPCALGSLKSNLGHAESAAGVLGLIKATLALEKGLVPRSIHFERLPAHLQAIETQLFIPQETVAWPVVSGDGPRRAAVSSYGMSGTNAHVVLEAGSRVVSRPRMQIRSTRPASPFLIPLSATSEQALRTTAGRIAHWLEANAEHVSMADVARTLACSRGHRSVRQTVIARDVAELCNQLRQLSEQGAQDAELIEQEDRGPVFVFSGQGSQWAGMGAELLDSDPTFAKAVAVISPLIQDIAEFSVIDVLRQPEALHGIERIQPAIFTMQVAMAAALREKGVVPSAVIGHSLGEVAAAVVAGALSLENGVKVICHRAMLCRAIAGLGSMAVVEMGSAALREDLVRRQRADVEIAVLAAPSSTVVGGAPEVIRMLVEEWQAEGIFAREVAVDVASHTSQVNPILSELAERLADIKATPPQLPIYSTSLIDPREEPVCDGSYFVDNLRQTVRFRPAVQAAFEDGHRLFIEIAPHPIVARAVLQTAAAMDLPVRALPSMLRDEPLLHGLLGVVGAVYTCGGGVDFSALYPYGELLDLPLPAWTNYLLELKPDRPAGGLHHVAASHPLLNVHRILHEEPPRHVWASEVGLATHSWLADHLVNGVPLFPGAAYCEMALAAGRAALKVDRVEVYDITFERALRLEPTTPFVGTAILDQPGHMRLRLESQGDGDAQLHASARLAAAVSDLSAPVRDIASLRRTHVNARDSHSVWQWFEARGIVFGPSFRALAPAIAISTDGSSLLADLNLPTSLRRDSGYYVVHPVLLDAGFQSVAAFPDVSAAMNGRMLLPLSVRRLTLYHEGKASHVVARLVSADSQQVEADLELLDASGRVLIVVDGLVMGGSATGLQGAAATFNGRLLDVAWEAWNVPSSAAVSNGPWLLIDSDEAGRRLTQALGEGLRQAGDKVSLSSCAGPLEIWYEQLARQMHEEQPASVMVILPRGTEPAEPDAARAAVSLLMWLAQFLLKSERRPRFYVVTCLAQRVRADDKIHLCHAGVRGWLRAVGAEFPALHPTQIDIDLIPDTAQLLRQMLSGSKEDETALRGTNAYVARLRRLPMGPAERLMRECNSSEDGMRIEIRNPSDLQSLEMVASARRAPSVGEVEIAIHATSVNFADVLVALGRYPTFEGRRQELGLDFAGIVTSIGADVVGLRVGDRVAGMCSGGAWGNFVTCDARLVVRLPDSLTDIIAAAVLTTTATALHGLKDLAGIGPGDKVLIHSATGGVGQAALAIARVANAEIYATAGTEVRRDLLRAMGVSHVYDSRSTAFADDIRRDTNGYGVDIVLNSLTGAAQRAGLESLAPGGRFVEIGKKDIYGDSWMCLSPFKRNLSFFAVDLALMCSTAPRKLHSLLSRVIGLVADGRLPPPGIATYPFDAAAEAIRILSNADHTGKLVLTVPPGAALRLPVPPERTTPFRKDGAYIITGGLGGLGLFLAEAMASAGCGRLILNGRSAPSDAARAKLVALRASGTEVEIVEGDIAQPATAGRLVAAATATGLALRGILHGAAVVDDGILSSVSDERLQRNWAPKVDGAWHLHVETLQHHLDWFCCFSSVAALFGSPGQSAYAAANSWLDGFTCWRRAQGLPSSSVAWAAWAEIGAGTHLATRGDAEMIAPRDGAFAFEALLRHDLACVGYSPIDGSPWLSALAGRSPFASGVLQGNSAASEPEKALRAALQATLPAEWAPMLRKHIIAELNVILRRSVGADRPLFDYGLDSLGTLQLLTALEADTGVRLRASDVTTVRSLADRLVVLLEAIVPARPTIDG